MGAPGLHVAHKPLRMLTQDHAKIASDQIFPANLGALRTNPRSVWVVFGRKPGFFKQFCENWSQLKRHRRHVRCGRNVCVPWHWRCCAAGPGMVLPRHRHLGARERAIGADPDAHRIERGRAVVAQPFEVRLRATEVCARRSVREIGRAHV